MNKDIIDPIATENNFEEDDFGDFVATPTILPLEPIAPKSLLPGMDFLMQLFLFNPIRTGVFWGQSWTGGGG